MENQKRQAEEIASQLAAEEAVRLQQEQERVEYEAMLASAVFADGMTVNDIDIGGMTMDEAKAALQKAIDAAPDSEVAPRMKAVLERLSEPPEAAAEKPTE